MTLRPGVRRAIRFAYGRRAAAALLLAVAAGLAVRLVVQRRYSPFTSDSIHYVLLARALAAGEGYVSGGSQHPDLSRSPVLPLFAAAVSRATGTGALEAGRLTVALTSALLVVPLFFLSRRLFGPLAALASLPLGALSCTIGTAIHVMPAAPYVLFATGAVAAVWSAGRGGRGGPLLAAGALAGAAALARPEGLVLALAAAGWAGLDGFARSSRRRAPGRAKVVRRGLARAALVVAGAAIVYLPYAGWASWRLGRLAPAPGIEYVLDMREICDRLSLRDMDGPDLPWAERALFVVSADRTRRVLETWFDTHVLLPPAAAFTSASGGADWAPPVPEVPTLRNVTVRRIRILGASLRRIPSVVRGGHFLPPVPVALGILGLVMALARRSRRRAIVFLSLMGAATLTPLFSHIEARFLYAPFVLGLAISAGGWGWVAARLAAADSPAGRALSTCVHLALAFGVVATGVRHPDGAVDPLARTALHREIAAQVAQVAGEGPVLAIQMNAPFWAGRAYRALPIGPPQVVLDYARAQGASCLVLEGERDLARRPELAPLVQDPPPAGFEQALVRPSPEGGELRVFRIGSAQGSERAIVPESGGSPDVMTRHAR